MGLSSNATLLALTQKKTDWHDKKTINDKAIGEQQPLVEGAQRNVDSTNNELEHLKELLGKTPQDNPEYTTLQGQIDKETDPAKKQELEEQLKKLTKENPDYTELIQGIENLEKTKLPEDTKKLEAEKGKEDGLELTAGEITKALADIDKEIEAEKQKLNSGEAKYEIEVTDDRGKGGLTNEMYGMFEDMKKAGILNDVDEFAELSNAQKKALYQKLDEIQKESKQDTNYSKMKAGDKFTYSSEQMLELAKAAGYDVAPEKLQAIAPKLEMPKLELPKSEMPTINLPKIKTPEQTKADNAVTESTSNIKLPRGIDWQGDIKGTSLADFGITAGYEDGKVVYTSSKGQKFTEKEVNNYFRSIENNVSSNYSGLLDKAEKLGVDYKWLSVDELKDAIKTAKKEAKESKKAETQTAPATTAPATPTAPASVVTSTESNEEKKTDEPKYTEISGWTRNSAWNAAPGTDIAKLNGPGLYQAEIKNGIKGMVKTTDPDKFYYKDETGKWKKL